MTKIKTVLISLLVALSFISVSPSGVSAVEYKDPACKGAFWNTLVFLDRSGKPSTDALPDGLPQICTAGKAISIVINLLLGFAGGVAVLFIILGGFWYMTSAGNAEQAEKGGKTLRNAIIGLVVILMSAVIVRIVTNSLTDIPQGGTPPVTSTPPSSTPSGSPDDFDPTAVFGGSIIMENSVTATGPLNVTAVFDASTVPYLKRLAGNGDPVNCTLDVIVDGDDDRSVRLVKTGTGYMANISFQGPFSGDTMSVELKVCQEIIATRQVRVVGVSAR